MTNIVRCPLCDDPTCAWWVEVVNDVHHPVFKSFGVEPGNIVALILRVIEKREEMMRREAALA